MLFKGLGGGAVSFRVQGGGRAAAWSRCGAMKLHAEPCRLGRWG